MGVSRRRFLTTTAAALAGTAARAEGGRTGRRLNLLWIMTDQQPVSTLCAYGNDRAKTPHMDRLAAEGVRFDRFYISAFPCSPSRACFLTGRYAHRHGVTQNDVPLADDVPCLGDVLKSAGYRTGYVGKWHLSGNMYRDLKRHKPFEGRWYWKRVADAGTYRYEHAEGGTGEDVPQHGFEHWAGGWKHYRQYLRDAGLGELVDTTNVGNHNDLPSGPDATHAYSKLPEEHHMAAFFAQEAAAFLSEQADSDRPFGLVVSFYGPHLPVAPPKPWDTLHDLDEVPLPPNHRDDLEGKPVGQRANRRCYKLPEWSEEQFRDYVRRYWGYCSYLDQQVGRILDALEAAGKADDTIVLFTSDHGDMVAAHGFVYKLCWCGYDELLRVPFLLRCPGRINAGATCDALVSSVDVLPSLLEMMDVPAPAGVDGRSFVSVIDAQAHAHRDVVVCNSMERNLTAVTDRWKYVLNWQQRDLDELYDLDKDPLELINLACEDEHKPTLEAMRGRIAAWLEDTAHPYRKTILEAVAKEPERRIVDLWPEVTDFKYLGGNEFEYRYVWHAPEAPPDDVAYWSFTHFANRAYGKDGDIVFRDTRWPDPPTTEWAAGEEHALGPVRIRIPEHAGPGRYQVRIGLWNPEKRVQPGHLLRGQGNSVIVGELTVAREGGEATGVTFRRRNSK